MKTKGGLHLHHLVWGICLMMSSGFLNFVLKPGSPWSEVLAGGVRHRRRADARRVRAVGAPGRRLLVPGGADLARRGRRRDAARRDDRARARAVRPGQPGRVDRLARRRGADRHRAVGAGDPQGQAAARSDRRSSSRPSRSSARSAWRRRPRRGRGGATRPTARRWPRRRRASRACASAGAGSATRSAGRLRRSRLRSMDSDRASSS